MSKIYEEFKVKGDDLVAKVKSLVAEGNVRRVIIKNKEGKTVVEIPLTLGVAGALLAPPLAAVSAIAALLSECTIAVVRDDSNENEDQS
ncbi:MAG TPA: DUF4342 domain-containing protein [Candidatus Nanopelagicaceae bacterium]|nr:DUF4342 domain-containing protein [Candidatus Nanopelagicaceae bacterium]